MDEVFQELAGLLRGFSRGQSPRDFPRAKPVGNPEDFFHLLLFDEHNSRQVSGISLSYHKNCFFVLLWHCYVPKIQYYLLIFPLVKKTSTCKTLILSSN